MNQSSKSRYFLVELLTNCLLFAVAAAICIAIFAHGNMTGKKSAALSMAVAEAQNVAESVARGCARAYADRARRD